MSNKGRVKISGVTTEIDEVLVSIRRMQGEIARGEWGTTEIEDALISAKKHIEIASLTFRRISTRML